MGKPDYTELDLHGQMIMEEYFENIPLYEKMKEVVTSAINSKIAELGIYVNAVESRIKAPDSLAGKLQLKGYKYGTIADLTDILGLRVITFYSEEVDKIAALAESMFDIDWQNSVDKRKMHQLDSFGYMSLHFICRIPESLYHDPEMPLLNSIRFELQMRTVLQHVWATINHDTGYKSGMKVPVEHLRSLNCIAGMLELVDEQFSKIRRDIADYRRKVHGLVSSGTFDDVPLDSDTWNSYLSLQPFKKLVDKVASLNMAEVYHDSMLRYIEVFTRLGFKTLGDIEKLKGDCSDDAYKLTLHQLGGTDLDILAESVVLQNLCVVYLIKNGYGVAGLQQILFDTLGGTPEGNRERSRRIMEQAHKINLID